MVRDCHNAPTCSISGSQVFMRHMFLRPCLTGLVSIDFIAALRHRGVAVDTFRCGHVLADRLE